MRGEVKGTAVGGEADLLGELVSKMWLDEFAKDG